MFSFAYFTQFFSTRIILKLCFKSQIIYFKKTTTSYVHGTLLSLIRYILIKMLNLPLILSVVKCITKNNICYKKMRSRLEMWILLWPKIVLNSFSKNLSISLITIYTFNINLARINPYLLRDYSVLGTDLLTGVISWMI